MLYYGRDDASTLGAETLAAAHFEFEGAVILLCQLDN